MTIEQLADFFKWMSIINIILLLLSTFIVSALKPMMVKTHARLFGITEAQISVMAYLYLGILKVLTLIFSITPYIALRIIS